MDSERSDQSHPTAYPLALLFFLLACQASNVTPPTGEVKVSDTTAADIQKMLSDKGEKLTKRRYYNALIATYQEMLKIRPNDPQIRKNLALAHLGAEDYDQAKPMLNILAAQKTTDPEVYYGLAVIAQAEKDPEAAKKWLEQALALKADHKASLELKKILP